MVCTLLNVLFCLALSAISLQAARTTHRALELQHQESRRTQTGRESVKRGEKNRQNYVDSCSSQQSSSSSSSCTWTEPPSRSAVRCDPRVSLLVTGVGWDSLPLGSGDLTQRAKRVEVDGREVVRKKEGRTEGGGCGGLGGEVGRGIVVKVGRCRKKCWRSCDWMGMEEVEGGKQKKIIEDISQAEAGWLRQTMLIGGVKGSIILYEAQINTLKSHAGIKENSRDHLSWQWLIKQQLMCAFFFFFGKAALIAPLLGNNVQKKKCFPVIYRTDFHLWHLTGSFGVIRLFYWDVKCFHNHGQCSWYRRMCSASIKKK